MYGRGDSRKRRRMRRQFQPKIRISTFWWTGTHIQQQQYIVYSIVQQYSIVVQYSSILQQQMEKIAIIENLLESYTFKSRSKMESKSKLGRGRGGRRPPQQGPKGPQPSPRRRAAIGCPNLLVFLNIFSNRGPPLYHNRYIDLLISFLT